MSALLDIQGLSVALPKGSDRPLALDQVSLQLQAGEMLCVVGESGSGKSVLANTIMRLLPPAVSITGGKLLLQGDDLLAMPEEAMRGVRGARIAMIFQEPMTALNPLRNVGDQIGEMFRIHTSLDAKAIEAKVLALLQEVRIPHPEEAIRAFPHELSGGQRQRVMIAMALALEPSVIIADEPTTALDVTTQAQILHLLRDLQQRRGTAVLFITHDFGVVAEIADRIAVMRHGVLVEEGPAEAVLNHPQHAYTQSLIAAVPPLKAVSIRPPVTTEPVLEIAGATKIYRARGLFGRHGRETKALDDVSLTLRRGSTLGIVGESGSGKSTLARCIMRLLTPDSGSIRLEGQDIASLGRDGTRKLQMVFQDPYASLNPRRRAGELVAQGPMVHGTPRREAFARAEELFRLVGLKTDALRRYPHEFSGGQRQRIGLARALALHPEVLVADEAVSALDVSVQAQVLKLLAELRDELGLSIVFVTHDLRVAAQICDWIAVMQRGRVVEEGPTGEVFGNPRHEYTRALLASVPGQHWVPPTAAA